MGKIIGDARSVFLVILLRGGGCADGGPSVRPLNNCFARRCVPFCSVQIIDSWAAKTEVNLAPTQPHIINQEDSTITKGRPPLICKFITQGFTSRINGHDSHISCLDERRCCDP